MKAEVLLIEDDAGILPALERELQDEGYGVTVEQRGDTGLDRARRQDFDVVLTDLKMPGLNGLELVRQLHAVKPRLPIILMTAFGTTETAIEATKLGAFDYVVKPFDVGELLALLGRAVASSRLSSGTVELGQANPGRSAIVGQSRAMQELYKEIGRVAATPVTVLIRGETGTGKELVARAIRQHSDRANGSFIAVNCAAVPETLLESELFGHERGSFTGAEARRIGRFEQAGGGTLFLDEIGDIPPGTQSKLLRALQERSIQRVGGKETIPVDVRILAATNRNLETAIQEKQFREDLFYRLNVVTILVPPLHQRLEDIPELVRFFLQRFAAEFGVASPSIQPEAVAFLQEQPWPGNIRQLENVVRQALVLARGYTISLEHIRQLLARSQPSGAGQEQTLPACVAVLLGAAQRGEITDAHTRLLDDVERELFTQAIHLADGNQAKAARWLGVTRVTMREKLIRFGLHPGRDKATPPV
ncbi:MAG: sigma-54-dependent Fis family transcriptional regulator [Verrucomicrobia bacterium]|nr:sigma-54-dependent Fis family transcriptional regulator [Verrucomicrobiota bacterium]